jgi:beta-phosphoglucomutase
VFPIIKAVLFDLDGTIAPLKIHHFHALNKALVNFGYAEISYEDHIKKFDGLPTKQKMIRLEIDPLDYKDIEESKQSETILRIKDYCSPIPGQLVFFDALKKQGYLIICCSNAKRQTVETALERMQTLKFFDHILANDDVENTKPHPEIYLKAMRRFWLKPEQCLVLEDNPNGIEAAAKAGCHLLVVDDPYQISYTAIKKRIYEANLSNWTNTLKGFLNWIL